MLTDALEDLQRLKEYQAKIEHSEFVDQDLVKRGTECKVVSFFYFYIYNKENECNEYKNNFSLFFLLYFRNDWNIYKIY